MGAGDEGRVTDQRHAAERNLRRFKIEDRLQDDLRGAGHQRGQLRCEESRRVAFDAGDQFGPDQGRRDRQAVGVAGRKQSRSKYGAKAPKAGGA